MTGSPDKEREEVRLGPPSTTGSPDKEREEVRLGPPSTTGSPDKEREEVRLGPPSLTSEMQSFPCGFSDAYLTAHPNIYTSFHEKQENSKTKLIQAGICENWWVLE